MTLDDVILENEAEVVAAGNDSPVDCDWDVGVGILYNLPPLGDGGVDQPGAGEGGGAVGVGNQSGGVGGDPGGDPSGRGAGDADGGLPEGARTLPKTT